jgi:pantetheine-phosphate adenylyltransferase
MKARIALFPGSFDPFTRGHEDVVLRGLKLFDKIIIAIGINSRKQRYFDVELMRQKIGETFRGVEGIEVMVYNELTASFAKKQNAGFLLRGLRNTTDFEYENSIAQINHDLHRELETIFVITSPSFAFISSSIIREVHRYQGDISAYVPYQL